MTSDHAIGLRYLGAALYRESGLVLRPKAVARPTAALCHNRTRALTRIGRTDTKGVCEDRTVSLSVVAIIVHQRGLVERLVYLTGLQYARALRLGYFSSLAVEPI